MPHFDDDESELCGQVGKLSKGLLGLPQTRYLRTHGPLLHYVSVDMCGNGKDLTVAFLCFIGRQQMAD